MVLKISESRKYLNSYSSLETAWSLKVDARTGEKGIRIFSTLVTKGEKGLILM